MKLTNVLAVGALGLLLTATNSGMCQSGSVRRAAFEVASIHRDDPASTSAFHMTQMRFYDDGLRVDHASVRTMLAFAYDMDEDQIEGGPPWIGSDSFEIQGMYGEQSIAMMRGMAADARRRLEREMLINLLFDRFGLQLDRKDVTGPIYAVVVGKGGVKLHPSGLGNSYVDGLKILDGAPAGSGFVGYRFQGGSVDIPAQAGHVSQLVRRLNANARPLFLDRKIIDRTGLTGAYDFVLTFTVPWIGHVPESREIEALDGNTGSTLSESLSQQLGLELQRSTGQVPVLVVKALNRPSEN